jgi:hypothetical protein
MNPVDCIFCLEVQFGETDPSVGHKAKARLIQTCTSGMRGSWYCACCKSIGNPDETLYGVRKCMQLIKRPEAYDVFVKENVG